ncbi:HAD-IA family hydrolase [Candidatus Dependentiae bacterium]|nr:HAD-IA family hydrolase [Candidatus Dependentiae bacterium]
MQADITSIIFDIGGVLLDGNAHSLLQELDLPDDEKTRLVDFTKSEAWRCWDAGKITQGDLVALGDNRPALKALLSLFLSANRAFIDETWQMVNELRGRGYKLYILSNFSHESYETFVLGRPEFFNLFDGIVCSSKHGKIKPDPEIYLELFYRFKIDPANALFIDDSWENIDAGQKIGLKGLHYQPGTLKEKLADMLFERRQLKKYRF